MSKKGAPQIILDVGFDFSWDTEKVWALDLPIELLLIQELLWHFDIPFWEKEGTDAWNLTPWEAIRSPEKEPSHVQRIKSVDIQYPLDIMWNKGRWLLLDGLHRLVKLYENGEKEVRVRKVPRDYIPQIRKFEEELGGGRITDSVVRIGNTVRRSVGKNGNFTHQLLSLLQAKGLGNVPQFLGIDEQGREILSFVEGEVPSDLSSHYSDAQLISAVKIMKQFHDATTESELAGDEEVVCHNDLSPCNYVFRENKPVGIIDFDAAAPGKRMADLAYAIWLWLDLGSEEYTPVEQARRIGVMCQAYEGMNYTEILVMIDLRQKQTSHSLLERNDPKAAEWVQRESEYLHQNWSIIESELEKQSVRQRS